MNPRSLNESSQLLPTARQTSWQTLWCWEWWWCVQVCDNVCTWMMRAQPVDNAGDMSSPTCNLLEFHYWLLTNQWAHWGCRLILEFHNNTQCVLMCVFVFVCAWFGPSLGVHLASMWSRSDVRGFSTISAAISIFIREYIQSLWNPPANPSHPQRHPQMASLMTQGASEFHLTASHFYLTQRVAWPRWRSAAASVFSSAVWRSDVSPPHRKFLFR